MGIMHSEMTGRLDHWMRTLKNDFYKQKSPVCYTDTGGKCYEYLKTKS